MSHVMHADKVCLYIIRTGVLKVIRNRKNNKEEYVKASIEQQQRKRHWNRMVLVMVLVNFKWFFIVRPHACHVTLTTVCRNLINYFVDLEKFIKSKLILYILCYH